jgi:hypothetical protein
MSIEASIANHTLHADPALAPFPIDVLEEADGARWALHGRAPCESIKRRAGSIAKRLSPASVWLVNRIVVEPDQISPGVAA